MDTVVQREGGMNWEIRVDIHPLPCVKKIASEQHNWLGSALCDGLEGCERCPRWRGCVYTCRDSLVPQKLM